MENRQFVVVFLTFELVWCILIFRYIRLEYEPVFGLENICQRFNDVSHDTTNDFVEGLQYSLDEAVIMTGVMIQDHEVDHTKVPTEPTLHRSP